jgi:hypothetical protein
MKFEIKSIFIDKENCQEIIEKIKGKIQRDVDFTDTDKRKKEIEFPEIGKRIDMYVTIGTYSEYEHSYEENEQGGLKCTYRSANIEITMYDSHSGREINYETEINIIDELEQYFSI